MTLMEAIKKRVAISIYGTETVELFHYQVTDYLDRLTHSEFAILLSEALEQMKKDK